MKGTLSLLTVLVFAVGCASVDVTRINTDNRDTAKGFRYYLPRPYVVVNAPYPVAGADYLVPAEVRSDGRFHVLADQLSATMRSELEAAGVSLVFSRDEIRVSEDLIGRPPPSPGAGPEAQPHASTPSSGAATPPPPPPAVASDPMMTGSTVQPATLPKEQKTFLVTAKVAKNATAAPIQISDPGAVVVGLVPFDAEGNPKVSAFVALEGLPSSTTLWKADTDGSYVATGSREQLLGPGSYAIALKFSGTVGQVTGAPLVLHQVTPAFAVIGPAGKPSAPIEPKKPDKGSESSGQTEFGGTKGLLATAGDPDTNPHLKLGNGLFDILYMPDLEEQYAINVKAGLGTAGFQLGLENGWMVERANVHLDNTELGKFIFRNIDKFTDIGALALKAAINPVLAGIPADSEAAQQSRTPGTRATLRIIYTLEAQPGLYPVLKMSEVACRAQIAADTSRSGRFLYLASLPDTRVSYNVRRTLAVQLVSLVPSTTGVGGPGRQGCAPGTAALPAGVSTALATTGMIAILKSLPNVDDATASRLASTVTDFGQRDKTLVICVTSTDQNALTTLKSVADLSPVPKLVTDMGFEKIEVIVK